MKELFLKIRHWLIQKLGGYTEQQVIIQRHNVINASVRNKPSHVLAEVRVDNNYRVPVARAFEYTKQEMRERLAEELIKKRLARFSSETDPVLNVTVFRAELFVMDPHDATICGI